MGTGIWLGREICLVAHGQGSNLDCEGKDESEQSFWFSTHKIYGTHRTVRRIPCSVRRTPYSTGHAVVDDRHVTVDDYSSRARAKIYRGITFSPKSAFLGRFSTLLCPVFTLTGAC